MLIRKCVDEDIARPVPSQVLGSRLPHLRNTLFGGKLPTAASPSANESPHYSGPCRELGVYSLELKD